MKIIDILTELETWISLSDEIRIKAEKSDITSYNNEALAGLLVLWNKGVYDEDPDVLHNELTNLL